MKKLIASFLLCAVLFVIPLFPAQAAQMGDEKGTTRTYGVNDTDGANGMNSYRAYATGMNDHDNTDWGWVGLFGLVGLIGLAGRNRGRNNV